MVDGQQYPAQGLGQCGAVQSGRLQDVVWDRAKALGHEEGSQRGEHGGKHQRPLGIQKAQLFQNAEIRHQRHLQGKHHDHDQQEQAEVFAGKGILGKAKSRQHGQYQLTGYDQGAQTQSSPEGEQICRGGQQHLVVSLQGKSALGEEAEGQNLKKWDDDSDQQQRRCDKGKKPRQTGGVSFHERAASFRITHR